MKNIFAILGILLSVSIFSCEKDEVDTVIDPLEPSFVLGCIDENAENFNIDATDDNGSCTYSVSYMLAGEWNIQLLEYESDVDLSQIDPSILPEEIQVLWPLIIAGLGNSVNIEGEAQDAGAFQIMNIDNTYNQVLVFDTEPTEIEIPIVGAQEIPSIPIDISSSGGWMLQDNEEMIVFIDSETGSEQAFEILTLSLDIARFKGSLNVPFDLAGLFSIDIDLDLDLQLNRVN